MQTQAGEITRLLAVWCEGDRAALDELWPLIRTELHRLARRHLSRERKNHTIQPSSLVQEAFLRLVSSVGIVLIDEIPETDPHFVTNAVTIGGNMHPVDIGDGATQMRAGYVEVVLSSNIGASFVDGTTRDQAITLLHELGHVYSLLFGPQSTKIADDGKTPSTSIENTNTIRNNCFPQ